MATIERTGTSRILTGTAGVLEITVYSDGVATDPTVPSVAVVDDTGAAVTVGAATASGGATGRVTATIAPAATATVNNLTATWTLTLGGSVQTFVTYHKIVGDLLFSLAEMRAFDQGAVASVATYPDREVIAMRDMITEAFEEILPFALGTQFTRNVLSGNGLSSLYTDHYTVTAVRAGATRSTTTWTALTTAELADLLIEPDRILRDTSVWSYGSRNVRLDYEHGWQPIPQEIRRAGLWVARNNLTGTNLPRNAISQIDELGSFRLATPGERGSWFGIPDADRVLHSYVKKYSIPGVA